MRSARVAALCSLCLLLSANIARAEEESSAAPLEPSAALEKVEEYVQPGLKWYLHYRLSEGEEGFDHRFHVSRGYITFKLKVTDWFQPRATLDAHQDDEGDWEVRLKYLYGKFIVPLETRLITRPNVEVGLVHTPWLDYEEHINHYRMQGTMALERSHLFNSADLGITAGALLGERLDADYRQRVSSHYPGRWGSVAVGLYNGGGYHAEEQNPNKVFMSRLSLRPLGWFLPNLQLSYYLILGKGNTADEPDWSLHNLFASFEHEYFVLTGQYGVGAGSQKGTLVDAGGEALSYQAYSVFAEGKLPWIHSSLIARYDRFAPEREEPASHRFLAGYAFHFYKHNTLLLDLDAITHDDQRLWAWQATATLQVAYP